MTKPLPPALRRITTNNGLADPLESDWQILLTDLAKHGNITRSCTVAQITRSQFDQQKRKAKKFAAQVQAALVAAADGLEDVAYERAVNGMPRYVVSHGKLVCDANGEPIIERTYSDTLLSKMLSAAKPEKYRERYEQRTVGPDDGPVEIKHIYAEIESRVARIAERQREEEDKQRSKPG